MHFMYQNKGKSKVAGAAMLIGASFVWGVAFVAQTVGMEYVGPFTFSTVRCLLAALALWIAALIMDKTGVSAYQKQDAPRLWKYGVLLGVVLFFAINLQQYALQYTTTAKAGFITSLYIVLVPVFGLVIGQKVHPVLWICVALAVAGLYFLSIQDGFTIGFGDFLVLLCAVCFAVHILLVGKMVGDVDCIRLCCVQFLTVGLLSVIPMLLTERVDVKAIGEAWLPIVYAGVLSGGLAYALQLMGQQRLEPATASLLMSPESVFAALAGWVLLGQTLNGREALGCILVFLAVVLSQIPWKSGKAGR